MKYILDSSVGTKWALPEDLSDKALLLRDEFSQGVHELLAPDVLPMEVGHALTRAERQGRISTADGFALWSSVMANCPALHSSLALMPRAYVLSSLARVGIYDCLYIALAEQEQCDVVTADERLKNTFPKAVISLRDL